MSNMQELRDAVVEAARVYCVATDGEMESITRRDMTGLLYQSEFTDLHAAVKELQTAETASYGRAVEAAAEEMEDRDV